MMLRNAPRRLLQAGIRLYQWTLSPYLGRQCRFYPTCSHYAHEAIEEFGAVRGSLLAARRLGRCHPFHPGGVDLVPTQEEG
jgi:putative membrane protein insertion efficiency factor